MSKKYCYAVVEKTLTGLLYKYKHFLKLVDLAANLVTYCDPDGNLLSNVSVPKNVDVTQQGFIEDVLKLQKKLYACKLNSGTENWAIFCSFICDNFKPVEVSSFFYKLIPFYQTFNSFMAQKLLVFSSTLTNQIQSADSNSNTNNKSDEL